MKKVIMVLLVMMVLGFTGCFSEKDGDAEQKVKATRGSFVSTYSTMYFRGTPNEWKTTPMELVADNTWQIKNIVTGSTTTERFKVDVYGDWKLNYGLNGIEHGSDIPLEANNTYEIIFNDKTKEFTIKKSTETNLTIPINVAKIKTGDKIFRLPITGNYYKNGEYTQEVLEWSPALDTTINGTTLYTGKTNGLEVEFLLTVADDVQSVYPTMYYRGTSSKWDLQEMALIGDNLWMIDNIKTGSTTTERFKVDVYGDWKLNYGLNGIEHGSDIPLEANRTYKILFNDKTKEFKVILLPDSGIAMVSAGEYGTMVVKKDGTLLGFGGNCYAELGDRTSVIRKEPIKISEDVINATIGGYNSVVLKKDGTLLGSGNNEFGQLGLGNKGILISMAKITSNVSDFSLGASHTMILKKDGTLWGTGYNQLGELGDGTNMTRFSPVKIMNDVENVKTGSFHTMILKKDGTLWGTGYNLNGELGDGTNINKLSPVKVMSDVVKLFAENNNTMVIKKDGSLWGTGYNGRGELGDKTQISKNSFIKILDSVESVDIGNDFILILKKDGSLWATGLNDMGEFGIGISYKGYCYCEPIKVMENVEKVSAGLNFSIIVKKDGSLWGAGDNSYGQLGDGTTNSRLFYEEIKLN